ncbi:MAG: hypothetical protein H7296_13325 [Bacteroidia bacterium]|nr:hypothetical protein [Bacteroidia bacterium]
MRNILAAFVLMALIACNKSNSSSSDKIYTAVYEKSMAIKDYHTAITALQFMLIADSSKQAYLDTLPELYAAVLNYPSAEYYTDIALKTYPTSERFLQLKALCLQQKGDVDHVLDLYNKLYASTKKITYLYQIAAFQFSAQDMEGAEKTLKTLDEKMGNSKDSVDFMISETEKQKVPVRAAVFNMKAYMFAQKRDLPAAKKYFEMALKEYPDFVTARQNLMQLMQGGRQQ